MHLRELAQDIGHEVETRLSALSGAVFDPVIRLGVTGLARAGKTVFITSLVSNLLDRGRMPRLRAAAEGRIEAVWLQPQPDVTVARFDYEAHRAALVGDDPQWPDSTRNLAQLRLSFRLRPGGLFGGLRGAQGLSAVAILWQAGGAVGLSHGPISPQPSQRRREQGAQTERPQMTLRLILTRHAKSSWDDPTMADHDRPLNARGRASAGLIGAWLASRALRPDEVLCSDALRTRQTWDGIAAHLGTPEAELRLTGTLYGAGPDVMLAVLRGARKANVMMIGHNPGIAEFAARLSAHPLRDPEAQRYPTGATLVLTFEADNWADVGSGSGAQAEFVTPRALAA